MDETKSYENDAKKDEKNTKVFYNKDVNYCE